MQASKIYILIKVKWNLQYNKQGIQLLKTLQSQHANIPVCKKLEMLSIPL